MVCQRAPEKLLLLRLLAGHFVNHWLAAQTDYLWLWLCRGQLTCYYWTKQRHKRLDHMTFQLPEDNEAVKFGRLSDELFFLHLELL